MNKFAYKKIIALRKNIRPNSKILKFKKNKWNNFLSFLNWKNLLNEKPQSHFNYKLSKFAGLGNSFWKRFLQNFLSRKRFFYFYRGYRKSYLKKQLILFYNSKKSTNFKSLILEFLESWLDNVIYRSHFAKTIKSARQLIAHGHVKVNWITVNLTSYKLKPGDIVTINSAKSNLIKVNLTKKLNSQKGFWPIPPNYLLINYASLEIIFGNIKGFDFSVYFPFNLNINALYR